jgi:hypothetical protein
VLQYVARQEDGVTVDGPLTRGPLPLSPDHRLLAGAWLPRRNRIMTDQKPTPTDEQQEGQPAPETQPDPRQPDYTRQGQTDEEQDEEDSTAPGGDD